MNSILFLLQYSSIQVVFIGRTGSSGSRGSGTGTGDTAEGSGDRAEGKAPGYEGCAELPVRPLFPLPKDTRPRAGDSAPSPRVRGGGGRGLEGTTERLINAGEPGLGDSGPEPICGVGAQAGDAGNSGKVSPHVPTQRVLGPGHPCGVPSRVDGQLDPPVPRVSSVHTGV